ncbi:MAG TPA: O-antigen ligase domain-containing protein [Phycisphaerae bacterium]|jgi:hypothetical protein|nr:O-antigen ligase domain-containing protein [Phycisphaerae bacterium]
MNMFVDIVMFGWIPVVLLLFAMMPARRAVIAAFIIAWSFLPMASYHIQGLPAYSKMSATCGGVLLGAMIFDMDRLLSFRPSWVDIPMLVWCLCPCASSLSNGLGLYDGVSAAFAQTVTWGFPYIIGRLYLSDLAGAREMATGILMGGLAYVPLCWWEARMSPQLHRIVYGYHQFNNFNQTIRYGGYRPTVFMDHGLMVGMWMSMAALVGVWAWRTGAVKRVFGIPILLVAIVLVATAVICKSTGALALLLMGLVALWAVRLWKLRILIWALIIASPLYIGLRITKTWDGSELTRMAEMLSSERSHSMQYRLDNENLLIDHAMDQPIFGWAGWNRSQVYIKSANAFTVVDGQWINSLGLYGIVGMVSLTTVLLFPCMLVLKRYPPTAWNSPAFGAAGSLLMISVLYMLDNIPNAMVNPVYVLAIGGITGMLTKKLTSTQQPAPQLQRYNGPRRRPNRPSFPQPAVRPGVAR